MPGQLGQVRAGWGVAAQQHHGALGALSGPRNERATCLRAPPHLAWSPHCRERTGAKGAREEGRTSFFALPRLVQFLEPGPYFSHAVKKVRSFGYCSTIIDRLVDPVY